MALASLNHLKADKNLANLEKKIKRKTGDLDVDFQVVKAKEDI